MNNLSFEKWVEKIIKQCTLRIIMCKPSHNFNQNDFINMCEIIDTKDLFFGANVDITLEMLGDTKVRKFIEHYVLDENGKTYFEKMFNISDIEQEMCVILANTYIKQNIN